MVFKIKTTKIDYYVSAEDIDPLGEMEEDVCEREVEKVKNSLSQELILEIDCKKEDLDYEVCEAVSEETFWLTNGVSYEIIK